MRDMDGIIGWRVSIGTVALTALLAACDLSHADEVTRSPDLAPVVPSTDDAAVPEDGRPPSDAPAATNRDADAALDASASRAEIARDGRDGSVDDAGWDTRAEGPAPAIDGCAPGADCAEGPVVLRDDFEDGINGWMSLGITWGTSDDRAASGTNAVATPTATGATTTYFAAGAWRDITLEVRVRVNAFGPGSSLNRAEVFARFQEPGQWYALGLRADHTLALRRNASTWGSAVPARVREGEWHTLKLRVAGPRERVTVDAYLDGMLLATAIDTESSLASEVGTVGLGVYGETIAEFDDVVVYAR